MKCGWISYGLLSERFRRGSRLFRQRLPVGIALDRTAFGCSHHSLLKACIRLLANLVEGWLCLIRSCNTRRYTWRNWLVVLMVSVISGTEGFRQFSLAPSMHSDISFSNEHNACH